MQHDPNARTQITEVDLPSELTTPLPEDAGPLVVAARTAAETALGVRASTTSADSSHVQPTGSARSSVALPAPRACRSTTSTVCSTSSCRSS